MFGTARIVLQLSFPEFFFFFGTKKGILFHSAVRRWRARGARWQLRFSGLSLQRRQTMCKLHVAAGNMWRLGWSTAGCGSYYVWPVTHAICEPQDRWAYTPWELRGRFHYPISHTSSCCCVCLPSQTPKNLVRLKQKHSTIFNSFVRFSNNYSVKLMLKQKNAHIFIFIIDIFLWHPKSLLFAVWL